VRDSESGRGIERVPDDRRCFILAICDGHVVCVPAKPVGSLQALTLVVRSMRVSSATTPSSIACLITGLTQKLLVKGEKKDQDNLVTALRPSLGIPTVNAAGQAGDLRAVASAEPARGNKEQKKRKLE
jgi:hypothetical protein